MKADLAEALSECEYAPPEPGLKNITKAKSLEQVVADAVSVPDKTMYVVDEEHPANFLHYGNDTMC